MTAQSCWLAHVHRGAITKQGSRLVRWAAVESVQILPKTSTLGAFRDRIGAKRGHNIARGGRRPQTGRPRLLRAA